MSKNLVLQRLRNQRARRLCQWWILLMYLIQPTDYLCVFLCKNDHKKELKILWEVYPHVFDIILDIKTCKSGPEKVSWQRHSYVKVNHALEWRPWEVTGLTDSMLATESGTATRAMNPCCGHEPLEHYHFTTLSEISLSNDLTKLAR